MRHALSDELARLPDIQVGERIVVLSDDDIWDTSSGCSVYLFLRDFSSSKSPVTPGVTDEVLREALLSVAAVQITVDELVDCYIESRFLRPPSG